MHIPLVLKVTAFLGGYRYVLLYDASCGVGGCCFVFGFFAACWVWVPWVQSQFFYCSNVVCLYLVVLMVGSR